MTQQALYFVEANSTDAYLQSVKKILDTRREPLTAMLIGEGETKQRVNEALLTWNEINLVASTTDKHPPELILIFAHRAETLSEALHGYIDHHNITLIAPITTGFYKNNPLFLISIPKSGTHLLFELAKAFGYTARYTSPEKPKGGEWYYVEYTNAHTRARHFFTESVYQGDFGLRDHPFAYSPALFIYRNPADVVSSEANYYHKKGRTVFYNYFAHDNVSKRLSKLINDPYLLGTIRDRILDYIAWLDFGNVIPLSFEELIGTKGGGCNTLQTQLIWSLQLKLHIPGDPQSFADRVFRTDSDTYFKGQCGAYRDLFEPPHYDAFKTLPQDFMEQLGYSLENPESVFSSRINEFRSRQLIVDQAEEWPPYIVNNQFLGNRIIKYDEKYYGVPFGTNFGAAVKTGNELVTADYADEVKVKLIEACIHDNTLNKKTR